MKEFIFTQEELSEMEAIEIKGGLTDQSGTVQNGCINSAAGCGSGTTQNGCTNTKNGCGSTVQMSCTPPPSTQAGCNG